MNILHALSNHLHLSANNQHKDKLKKIKKTALKPTPKGDNWGMTPEDALRVTYTSYK